MASCFASLLPLCGGIALGAVFSPGLCTFLVLCGAAVERREAVRWFLARILAPFSPKTSYSQGRGGVKPLSQVFPWSLFQAVGPSWGNKQNKTDFLESVGYRPLL